MRLLIVLFLTLCSSLCVAATIDEGATVKWGYLGNKGPAHWGRLNEDFALCAKGKEQSPINISRKTKKSDEKLVLNYQPAPAWVVDDGQTELQINNDKIVYRDGHGIQVNFHEDQPKELVDFAGETYRLIQFHMHTPSETEMFKQTYPLEIHFVHQGSNGHALVIAVLVKAGAVNSELAKLITQLPVDEGKEYAIKTGDVNPIDLIPAKKSGYYLFPGSLTTPPCTEGVQWLVMADTITASSAQIVTLRKAMGGPNARPVQALNKRRVYYVNH
jgi:carbonic anhydrase